MKELENNENDFNLDEELESLPLPDSIKLYMQEITSYPLLSEEEQLELIKLTKEGDAKAREKLINSNLRLVIKPAYKYSKNLTHLQFLDIIQSGNEGLIKSIDKYNPSLGALSTLAMSYIKGYILRTIYSTERSIHRSIDLETKITQYLKLVGKYKSLNEPLPSDEVLCDILDISLKKLKDIRDALTKTETSLNKKFYIRYFRKTTKRRLILMPKRIVYDLMQNQISNLFRVSKTTKEFVVGVLKTYYKEIGEKTRRALMSHFDIRERDFMSGKEKLHAYRTLYLIDRRIKMRNEEIQTEKRSTNENISRLSLTNNTKTSN